MTTSGWIASVVLVFLGWMSLFVGVMYFDDAAPGALALFPNEEFMSRLPSNTGILDIGSFWIILRSDDADLGKKLYEAGALIVLPAGLLGCFPSPKS